MLYPAQLEQHFDALYGLELCEMEEERVSARVEVRDAVLQPMGIVHGGVYASVAEGLCSIATSLSVVSGGKVAIGQSNNSTFLRPIRSGHIHATATPVHRGGTTWLWEVRFTDDEDRLCALSQVTIAVRERRGA
jgi:1,4-dihydroxy-2-naphthoyl-CoA hydrolase